MGNQSNNKQLEPEKLQFSHPYFENGVIIKESDKKFIKSRIYAQEKQYNTWKNKVLPSKDKESPLSHEHLYLPIKIGFDYDKAYCATTGHAINIYPYFQTLLSAEIVRRRSEKLYFKQSELWYLLYILAAAKADIMKFSDKVGDLKPENVFIYEDGSLKVGSILSSPNEQSSYQKLTNNQNIQSNYLLAPEDLTAAKSGLIDNKENSNSQIFSLGATVLSAGILENILDIYNYKTLTFDEELFKKLLNSWVQHVKYSEIFKSIVMNLVDLDGSKRIKFQQFWKFISRYNSSIKNRDPFIINSCPKCLQSGVEVIRSKKSAS